MAILRAGNRVARVRPVVVALEAHGILRSLAQVVDVRTVGA